MLYVSCYWICLFIYNLQNYQFFLPPPSKRNHFEIKSCCYQPQKPAFLLNTSKTCSNVKLFSIFRQTFFGTNFRDQNNKQLFCGPAVKKILRILCVWTLEMLYSNKRILTQKNVCLNIVWGLDLNPRLDIKMKIWKEYLSEDFLTAAFWQKLWMANKIAMKKFLKVIGHFESTLNCCLTHTTSVMWEARFQSWLKVCNHQLCYVCMKTRI